MRAVLAKVQLAKGAHKSFEAGVCLLELCSYLAGQPFSDHPPCVSPILGGFGRAFNDRLDDEPRQKLVLLAPRLLNTAGDGKDIRRREILWEWSSHCLVTWLRAAGLEAEAARIETEGRAAVRDVHEAAWAARMKARARLVEKVKAELLRQKLPDAAAYAADAAADAADDAAYAAAAAAYAAAYAAKKRKAVYDAVYTAVAAKMKPIADSLTEDGFALFDRLIEAA